MRLFNLNQNANGILDLLNASIYVEIPLCDIPALCLKPLKYLVFLLHSWCRGIDELDSKGQVIILLMKREVKYSFITHVLLSICL